MLTSLEYKSSQRVPLGRGGAQGKDGQDAHVCNIKKSLQQMILKQGNPPVILNSVKAMKTTPYE